MTRSRAPARALELLSVGKPVARSSTGLPGPPEHAALEPLVDEQPTVPIPQEQLHPVAAPVQEDEDMTAERVLADHLPRRDREPIEALSKIDGARAQVHADR